VQRLANLGTGPTVGFSVILQQSSTKVSRQEA